MKVRTVKIILDVLMIVILIHEWIFTEIVSVKQHFVMGLVFMALMLVHIALNRKWCISVTKALAAGKTTERVKRQYTLDWALLITWSLVGLTGLVAMGYFMHEGPRELIEVFSAFKTIHIAFAILGTLLIVVHLYQHKTQIRSYLTRKSSS